MDKIKTAFREERLFG